MRDDKRQGEAFAEFMARMEPDTWTCGRCNRTFENNPITGTPPAGYQVEEEKMPDGSVRRHEGAKFCKDCI